MGLHLVDERPVEALQRQEGVAQERRNGLRGDKNVPVTQGDEAAPGRAADQAEGGLGREGARGLRAYQGPRHVTALFGGELVQVEAAHPARDVRKAFRRQGPVPSLKVRQPCQQPGEPASPGYRRLPALG